MSFALRLLRRVTCTRSSMIKRSRRPRPGQVGMEILPLESRVLMYADSPCGTWAPPTPPTFCPI